MFTTKNLLIVIGRHILTATGVVLVAVIVIFFISSKIEGITNAIIEDRQIASTLERHNELLSTLKSDAELVGTNDTIIEQSFPPANDILGFTSALESLALRNGVTQSFRFKPPAPSSVKAPFPLFTISYSNNLSGNILTLGNYLKEFERIPYFTKIERFSITSVGKWEEAATISFDATIQAKSPQ